MSREDGGVFDLRILVLAAVGVALAAAAGWSLAVVFIRWLIRQKFAVLFLELEAFVLLVIGSVMLFASLLRLEQLSTGPHRPLSLSAIWRRWRRQEEPPGHFEG